MVTTAALEEEKIANFSPIPLFRTIRGRFSPPAIGGKRRRRRPFHYREGRFFSESNEVLGSIYFLFFVDRSSD